MEGVPGRYLLGTVLIEAMTDSGQDHAVDYARRLRPASPRLAVEELRRRAGAILKYGDLPGPLRATASDLGCPAQVDEGDPIRTVGMSQAYVRLANAVDLTPQDEGCDGPF